MKPRALKAGDRIRIVSPASPLNADQVEKGVSVLESAGYVVEFGQHVWDRDTHLAGTDADRARDLMDAFLDPTVSAVVCARGGYGCARLLPHLDLDAMAVQTKLFLGFSDITTLHLALNPRGLPTLHAPMPLTLSVDREPWVYDSLLAALAGSNPIVEEAPPATCLVPGVGEGVVTGGCLILICDAIGTPDAMDAKGKLVLLEDVDENPHRIDAMLTHLLNARVLEGAAGIVVGEMTRTDERNEPGIGGKPWREIVAERLAALGIPMVIEYPFGHNRNMLSLPLGIRARLDADAGTLTYLESLCA